MSIEAKIREAETYKDMGLLEESLNTYEILRKELGGSDVIPKSDIEARIKAIEHQMRAEQDGFASRPIPKEMVDILNEETGGDAVAPITEAEALQQLGLFKEAADVYRDVLKNAPDSGKFSMADVVTEMAVCLMQISPLETAVSEIESILDGIQTEPDLIAGSLHRVSDIHFEPSPISNKMVVRFRQDGVCHEYVQVPNAMAPAILSRLKIMANLDIAERRLPQDGKIKMKRKGVPSFELRMSTMPLLPEDETLVGIKKWTGQCMALMKTFFFDCPNFVS